MGYYSHNGATLYKIDIRTMGKLCCYTVWADILVNKFSRLTGRSICNGAAFLADGHFIQQQCFEAGLSYYIFRITLKCFYFGNQSVVNTAWRTK